MRNVGRAMHRDPTLLRFGDHGIKEMLGVVGLKVTLGARDFSCAVSGFGQVLKSDPRFAARVFGLRPTKLLVTREKKSLVPRVLKSLTGFKLCATTPNSAQQHATECDMTIVESRSNMQQSVQTDTTSNIQQC